jgi:hypothetical protein
MGSDKGGGIGSYEVRELGRNSGTRILGAAGLNATGCKRGSELDNRVQGVYYWQQVSVSKKGAALWIFQPDIDERI